MQYLPAVALLLKQVLSEW